MTDHKSPFRIDQPAEDVVYVYTTVVELSADNQWAAMQGQVRKTHRINVYRRTGANSMVPHLVVMLQGSDSPKFIGDLICNGLNRFEGRPKAKETADDKPG